MGYKTYDLDCACIKRIAIVGCKPLTCHCLLVELSPGNLLLIDTGLSRHTLGNLQEDTSFIFSLAYGPPHQNQRYSAVNRIREHGLEPEHVRHIILTHMDFDHMSGLRDFPHAEVHVHASEWQAASNPKTYKERDRYRDRLWAGHSVVHKYVNASNHWFGVEAIGGLNGLPDDIFLIPLPGHTVGHCGVAVKTEGGWVLHAGDAYFDPREINQAIRQCGLCSSVIQRAMRAKPTERLESQAKLRKLYAKHGGEIQIFCAHNRAELNLRERQTVDQSIN